MKMNFFICIYSLMLLSACTETRYVDYQDQAGSSQTFNRQVEFKVDKSFYQDPPDCVVVLPSLSSNKEQNNKHDRLVGDALARQLSIKINRVIGPSERDRLVRQLGLDISNPADRVVLTRQSRCRFFVQAKPWGPSSVNGVVWSETRVGLEVLVTRAQDNILLWQARHVATRSGGGIPLSPFSIVTNIVMAARFNADGDVPLSLIDDALRRMISTLPDTRYALKSNSE